MSLFKRGRDNDKAAEMKARVRAHLDRIEEEDFAKLLYGFFLDTRISKGAEMAVLYGAEPPLTDEDLEAAHKASLIRLKRLGHLVPLIGQFAHAVAHAATDYAEATMDKEIAATLPDAYWAVMERGANEMGLAVALGVVSQLIDLGFLELPEFYKHSLGIDQ